MNVFIILDCSASMFAGASEPRPFEQAVLAAALIAFSAERAGQRTGALFFNRKPLRFFPPQRGRRCLMALFGAAAGLLPESGPGSRLGEALAAAKRLVKRRSLAVILSDFYTSGGEAELPAFARRHDLIAIRIKSPLDDEIPPWGLVPLEDPETGYRVHAPSSFAGFRTAWREWRAERKKTWEAQCRRADLSFLELSTAASEKTSETLFRFFNGRRPR